MGLAEEISKHVKKGLESSFKNQVEALRQLDKLYLHLAIQEEIASSQLSEKAKHQVEYLLALAAGNKKDPVLLEAFIGTGTYVPVEHTGRSEIENAVLDHIKGVLTEAAEEKFGKYVLLSQVPTESQRSELLNLPKPLSDAKVAIAFYHLERYRTRKHLFDFEVKKSYLDDHTVYIPTAHRKDFPKKGAGFFVDSPVGTVATCTTSGKDEYGERFRSGMDEIFKKMKLKPGQVIRIYEVEPKKIYYIDK